MAEDERARLELTDNQSGEGRIRIAGELDFASVPALHRYGLELFPRFQRLVLDLGGVTRANSAGLALLLEWQGQARREGRSLTLLNMPPVLVKLARVSELEDLLPVA